ncbi:MAG TPA: hypothetical protein VLH38_05360 [Patescibacteria group bacterium]|nr:hypothetical protein [Patescibacteria group bacterium]
MIRPKLHNIKRTGINALIFAAVLGGSLFVLSPTQKVHAATTDCSDVFTPLSSFVITGVNANKSFYVHAMEETGVPWEMLAAIHYRETNFSHSNPSNGQGIFQFANGAGGPYPAGAVSDDEFYRQLKFMATKIQTDYVYRNSPNPASNIPSRHLMPGEQDINFIKNTLYSYNGRSSEYAQRAAQYGYNPGTTPFEGSPYVMNRFDCQRARMGMITQDYGSIDGTDTRYGTFTIFARLRGDSYWLAMTQAYSWIVDSQQLYADPSRSRAANSSMLAAATTYYVRVTARNIGSSTWTNSGSNPVLFATSNPGNRMSGFCDPSWMNCSRAAALIDSSVAPGEVGTFEFSIKTPTSYGTYNEYFDPVAEGKAWMSDIGMHYQFIVRPPIYLWAPVGQQIAADSGQTMPLDSSTLAPDTTYYLQLKAVNTGNTTWTNSGSNPVRLGTSGPGNRNSSFCTAGWVGCNRPAALAETSVAPGETGTFSFPIKTPSGYGVYKEYFTALSEGSMWMNDVGQYWSLTTKSPTAQWQYAGQASYTDSSKTTTANLSQMSNNTRFYSVLSARNTGNTTWTNSGSNPVRLGTSGPNDHNSVLCDSSWTSCNRAATLDQASVAPGQIGTFSFWMQAPYANNGTAYREAFQPVVEGNMWMNDLGLYWPITMQSSATVWQYMGQNAYSNSSRTTTADLSNATTNTTYYLSLNLKNTSGTTWTNSGSTPLRLGIPNNQTSTFCDNTWVGTGCNRPAALKESSVAPGQTGTILFSIKTPSTATTAQLSARPVIDGQAWLDDVGLYWPITTH